MAKNNVKRFLLLFALGVAYGFMYVMPYMKSSFYDQMIAAMGCTNAQLGSLMTYYTIALTISYLPGGWIGDKFNPKPVLLASIFGQAILSFLFMFNYQSYTMAVIIWCLMALTGGFAFWPSLMKGIRMTGTDEEQGRIFGIFEALNGCASLLLSFIMLGIMAIAGAGDLVTGFKSAAACMGGLSIVSGLLILFLCFIFPFVLVVINVFKTKADITTNPLAIIGAHGFTLKNFPGAMKKMNFGRVFMNSAIITIVEDERAAGQ